MAKIYVKVEPGSEEFSVETEGMFPRVHLTEEAENGRANSELLDRLEGILGQKPGIISGHRSRRKQVKVDLPKEEIMQKLEAERDG
ncbi:MAG: DUF167 domain-containing protein [Candidatus Nanohaloarchaea archaeon]